MGINDIIQEERIVANFSAISLHDFGQVYLEQGEEERLVVESTPELMSKIITEVKGETLHIRLKQSWLERLLTGTAFVRIQPIKYLVTLRDIRILSVLGDACIEAERLQLKQFELDIQGQGQVEVKNLSTEALCVNIHGQAKISIAGEIIKQDISLHGSGEVDLSHVKNQTTMLKIQGNGIVKLWCDRELDVSIRGMGKVYYRGNPKVKQHLSGLGELIRIE